MTDSSEKATSGARLVAVVVTYNRLAHLRTCLAALRGQACDAIVVVDNHSTDGTGDWLAEQQAADSRLDVLTMTRNLGGAGGFEAGFRHARARYRPEWLVCFDDDAWPQPGAFRAFLEADLDGIDAAAAAVYFPDGRICEMNRPGLNPFWHPRRFLKTVLGQGRQGFHLADADYRADGPVDIDSTSFVGFFVRGTMVDRVGLPEGRLFIYGDDVLYALNVRRQGGRIAFLPWVRFTHDCATFSTHEKTFEPLWKAYYTYRNGLRVYHTAAGALFWLFLPLKLARWLLNARHYDDARPYLRLTWAALRDAATGRYDRPHEAVLKMARGDP
ncbi:MAG: glycosyltransferase [Alcanivorax sp.]|uniref:glycosyltransferase n=1 Tax=Alloalcanivorax marinus TaxID=1177169 RepID=UPI0019574C20|nr:glycosyltransferase [Alloalcanivorax marinus]